MGTVYKAIHERMRRVVALKVLRPELAATLGPDRFRREIETAARTSPEAAKHGEGRAVKKVIVVPGRLVNVVV